MKSLLVIPLLGAAAFADHVAYTYDSAHRLSAIEYSDGTGVKYDYDPSGNLLKRAVSKIAPGTPSFSPDGVVNTASFKGGPVAPGEMITIFGSNLGPVTLKLYEISSNIVSGSVGEARFLFDGVPAPIYYVSSGVSTVIVPYEVAGKTSTKVIAEYKGVASTPITLPVAVAAPGIFTAAANGLGQAAAVNQDGTINSVSNPIRKGAVILLYLTGDGQTNPAGTNGKLALDTFPLTAADISVTIGGVRAAVQYAGVAPLSVAGVAQFNVVIPDSAPSGNDIAVVVTVAGVTSPGATTIAVK